MKKILSCLALAAGLLINPAKANTFGLDMSDLWWNPNESGWGVTLNHQGEVLFVTLFVYGADGKATWYGAPNTPFTGNTAEGASYSGQLYQLNGPPLGTPFSAGTVTARPVGNVTVTATSSSTATLVYTVDGVQVSKTIERQTWRTNMLSGNYTGAESSSNSCLTSGPFPPEYGPTTKFVVNNTANTFSMSTGNGNETCNYNGDYTQTGRLGRSSGTYTCGNGVNGTYVASEIEANSFSIAGRAVVKVGACTFDNKFAGVRN
ncbi:MAG: hypothetical protein JNN20_04880 [Betaproteobacteria bacterium]|nr:hypothetical protein [Betaproteobacteria bacterium]